MRKSKRKALFRAHGERREKKKVKKKIEVISNDTDSHAPMSEKGEVKNIKKKKSRKGSNAGKMEKKKKTMEELKDELDEHTWLELKHF
jgi:hypothetical protein